MFQLLEEGVTNGAVIKVVGVGGGGGNAVEHMVKSGVEGVEFICANTDAQALRNASTRTVMQLGGQVTKGLGAGANPDVGRQAAVEDRERIAELLQGADMVFVTAGMGGGTGTGAAPIVAEVAKDLGILTVAVVTKPFPFEGRKRMQVADAGIAALREHVDSLITIPNEKLQSVLGGGITLLDAFKAANDVLLGAVKGISDLITKGGIVNVDFADVRTVMGEMGMAMMGTGVAEGPNRAELAARQAISCPLLEDVDLSGARGLLVNITSDASMSLEEYSQINNMVADMAHPDATIICGTSIDPELGTSLSVTVVATGLGQQEVKVVNKPRSLPMTSNGEPDYTVLDRPAVSRGAGRHAAAVAPAAPAGRPSYPAPAVNTAEDLSLIDIPTFLRRQAD